MPLQRNRFVEELLPIIKDEPKTWIEIALKDTKGRPVSGAKCRLTLPDGSIHEENLNAQGLLRVDNIKPGTAHVNFPDFDPQHWHAA